ncbi:filamentous hemagglutinin N-terminal domain-containing protein [Tolypothrix sp. FACHB-123]|uniref:two-partner secretion domain-containing protein n=1 Tax=Tolypothrix sp. FACHB-123 TaxID=2692868 RepID=UPI0016840A65|nr:filamentous hemagglutinin N-terminal domain-containing protein [Tolypothrix sp. FACHB-123]MBD2354990.1 filamentous hemagglutinin N-terminal domain-containing protein [Tolypothrix sp. FACHB-123]
MEFWENIRFLMVSSLTYLTLAHFSLAKAQIIPDNTLGTESSVVNPDTIKGIPSDRIDGGAIRGSNLFHSFSEFNIDSGRGAYFTNPSGIENILTRVTGNNASQILGTLGVLGNANLFLINPNGIIFGKDAVIDIRGSFTATTADGIRLGENGLFSATNPQSSNLLTVKPGALFSNALSNQQATINNQGNLTVDAGKNINLFAANVINTGTLTAPFGVVQLTGTENLITRGNIATATLFLNTKNLTIGENNNATIDKTTLEGLSGNTNLILQGTNDITVDSLTNSTLNLADGSGKIAFIADADRDGIGNFQMNAADTIKTNGRDISISGANLTLGNIDTSLMKGGDIAVDVDAGGDIPASGTEGTAIFTFTVSDSQPIEDLDVQFSASHTWDSDLGVNLTSPSGTTLELFNRIGNDGDHFQDTVLDDSADTNINNASPPFQGRFKPTGVGGLASFNSENTTGIWQLTVRDCCAGDSGILYKAGETAPWGTAEGTKLMFRTPVISGNSGAITLNATNGSLNVGNINAGNSTTGGEVNLSATENISLNGSLTAVNNLKILADIDANKIGNFQMDAADTIKTNGRNAEIAGVSLTVGNIDSSSQQGGGNITLTATGGDITTGSLKSSSSSYSGNAGFGGAITVTTSQGNISTQVIDSSSSSYSGNAGDGGAIALTTTLGNISTQVIDSSSLSPFGNAGSGGAIALTTTLGNISTQNLNSSSFSVSGNAGSGSAITVTTTIKGDISTQVIDSSSFSVSGNAGSGGEIALTSTQGDISTQDLKSSSFSVSGNAGDGGAITLTTTQGNISTGYLDSSSKSESPNAGDGGAITLTTTQGNISTGYLNSSSKLLSSNLSDAGALVAGFGGAITLTTTQGNISTGYLDSQSYSLSPNAGDGGAIALTTTQGNISTGYLDSKSFSRLGNAGDGGAIAVTTTQGNISTGYLDSSSYSRLRTAGDGGVIAMITSGGDISTQNLNSSSSSISGNAGDGGAIAMTTSGGEISTQNLNSSSSSISGDAGDGGAIAMTTSGGDISTQNLNSSSSSISRYLNGGSKGALAAGFGGAITLTTTQGNISTQDLDSYSYSSSTNAGDGGAFAAGFGGAIALTTTQGNISTGNLDSQSYSISGNGGDGGAIALTTRQGNISTGNLDSQSYSFSENAGDGGAIALTTILGDISTGSLSSPSFSFSGNAGDGGAIALTTTQGNISTGDLNSFSISVSGNAGDGGALAAGFGGAIALSTTQGNISTQTLNSFSFSESGNSGTGGIITLSARDGNIINDNFNTATLNSFSVSTNGNSGKGGNVTLEAKNNITDLDILTLSSADKSGDVQVNGFGDLSLTNTNIITSKQVTIKLPIGEITLDVGGVGQSGNVNITSTGNLTFQDTRIESDTKGDNPAGNVNIFSPGTVAFNNSKIASNTSSIGNAGNIQINANNLTLTDSSEISANTTAEGFAGDITLNTPTLTVANGGKIFATTSGNGNGGKITVNAPNEVNLGIGVQDFAPILSVETSGAGKAGNIIVNTPSLTISDTARITATATATATNIQGGGSISLNASKLDLAGIVGIFAETKGQAPAGTLELNPYANQPNLDITLFPNSKISASTSGIGNGGDLIVKAPETINISGQGTLAVETFSTGKAGNIEITTQNLNLTDGVTLSAATSGIGNAGDIVLNTPTLNLTNGGKIFASTSGTGDGGTISVNALNSVNIGKGVQDFAPIISVETTGAGKAGDIIFNTPSLTVSDTARITATATATATNTQGGGSITLNASKLNLAGIVGIFAETQGQAPAGTLKLNPYANQPNLDITLFPNSNISASTSGSGKGGDLILTAPENINITGKGKLAVESTGIGDAGNILITTQNLNINDGVKISASTMNGQGGNININAHTLTANNGGQFLTTTSGTAKAGNINVQVRDNITLDGTNTGLFANTEKTATGDSGNITIDPEIFTIKNGAGIGVNSNGSGKGGNISLTAGTLILDNKAFINAATTSNNGGEIKLDIQDFLFLRRNSNITATAGTDFAGGNGGNITINSPFIVAVTQENSDITANAFSGQGGNINISTQGIFGIGFQAQQTAQSDITASSELGISGNVTINTPEVDPSKGLVQLSANLLDASRQIDNSCQPDSKQSASSFTITGRGGLPSNPYEYLQTDSVVKKWVSVDNNPNSPGNSQGSMNENPSPPEIVEAQGLIKGDNGDIYLVAQASQVIPHSPTLTAAACASSR